MEKRTILNCQLLIGLICLLLCLPASSAFAQKDALIYGKVKDLNTADLLIGASVVIDETGIGTTTDFNGNYRLNVPPGSYTVKFTFIGYEDRQKKVTVESGAIKEVNIQLEETLEELDIVVVSASRYEKNITEETVSVDVIKPDFIKNVNATDLSEALVRTSGVTIQDGQINIRNASGFSFGVGSRVQVLVDDLPMLAGDLNDVRWRSLPLESTEQVEVIKGASSVIYGSSALSGVVNVRTGYGSGKPETDFSIYQTIYGNAKRDAVNWWKNEGGIERPFATGAFVTHKQRKGNMDILFGGTMQSTHSYNRYGDEFRVRGNLKTRYRSKKNAGLSYGLNVNSTYEQSGRFFIWNDWATGAYTPLGGRSSVSNDQYLNFSLDPHLTYLKDNNSKHTLRSRYFVVARFDQGETGNAVSNSFMTEYQYQRKFKEHLTLTTGGNWRPGFSRSNLYKGKRFTYFAAAFAQLEYKYKDLTLQGGMRYEINVVNTPLDTLEDGTEIDGGGIRLFETTKPVFRIGLNYKAAEATFLRASWGQGFRFPSVGERYLDASFANVLKIFPNSDLAPERGWTMELALKQGFKVSKWLGYFDIALFWQQYRDFIEYSFGAWNPAPVPLNEKIGFRPFNVENARIAGFEVSVMGEGKIGAVSVSGFLGHTYTYPANLDTAKGQRQPGEYIQNLFSSFSSRSDEQRGNLLKYRNMHLLKGDVEFGYKRVALGFSFYYGGPVERIDEFLTNPIVIGYIEDTYDIDDFGVQSYLDAHSKGDFVMDMRAGIKLGDHSRISFIVKNVTNREYAFRPGRLQPPINFAVQYRYKIKKT